jgi:hypothetical protein
MDSIYYNVGHPAGFGGVDKLQKAAKTSKKKAVDFLVRSDVYTQYKPIRHRFLRRKTVARYKNELFQADLADFQKLSRYNRGYRYVLVTLDVLSKFVFYIPVKNKKAEEMQRAFNVIFKQAKPKLLQTDRGGEFTSKSMQDYFKRKTIQWYHTYSEAKATLAERQIRTLREKLARIFHHTGSYKYVHLLPKLADAYNRTKHSRTRMAPVDVNKDNEQQIFERLFGGRRRSSSRQRFHVGDQVRLAKTKGIFTKGHERRWTEEIFTVKRIKMTDPIMYYVEDIKGEEILGGFYGYELNRVSKKDTDLFDVEKVIKRRRDKDGKMHYFVKWRGYGNEHNSWVTDLQKK